MRKNIVLIDRGLRLFDSIYRSEKINIEYLIADYDIQVEALKKTHDINNIFAATDSLNEQIARAVSHLNYDLVDEFKATQIKSEHFHDRFSDDTNLVQYYYLCALSFWNEIFASGDIAAVVLCGVEHGANYDNLILDVAKSHGVSGYVIESFAGRPVTTSFKNELSVSHPSVSSYSVKNYQSKEYIAIDSQALGLTPINPSDYLCYLDKVNSVQSNDTKNIFEKTTAMAHSFKKRIPYGNLMALKHMVLNKMLSFYNVGTSASQLLRNMKYAKKLEKFYNSISVEFDTSKKCVFYALHFEPEASIMVRTRLRNQLMIIKLLSQSLPEGWVLYVKEHPDQFRLNKPGFWFFLITIHKFRTKEFYQEILKFDNVYLLKTSVKSKTLIQHSEAVASINGTIVLEAISFNKPLVLVGHESTPIGLCKDALKVTSSDQYQDALAEIEQGFRPTYSDFETIIGNYAFELSNFNPTNARLLAEYLVCEYKT